ncbi:MAG TPA: hypothetical protein PKD11_05410 [Pyrinomonadaceae bacterium]|nr:hypothetical protein [Pyrinomonadaceae bacterium]
MFLRWIAILGITLVVVSGFAINLNGQQCGHSTKTYSVFVRNGTVAEDLRYRVYPLGRNNSETLRNSLKKLFPYAEFTETYMYDKFFPNLQKEHAVAFVRGYRSTDFPTPDLENRGGRNYLAGTVVDGYIMFHTLETDTTPYLLEITADNKESFYAVSNLFGGCFGGRNVLLYERINP